MSHFLLKHLFILTVLVTSCSPKEYISNSIEIDYNAKTRGNSLSINYKKGSIYYKTTNIQKEIKLNEEAIIKLKEIVSNIKLSEIDQLISPSNKRFSDAAMIANFTISIDDKIYISSDFDHNNPPKKLLKLYTFLERYKTIL